METPSPKKPWLIAFGAAVAILIIPSILMWKVGLFDIPTVDPGTKPLAAALALVGVVLTAAVTLIGIVLKYSIDERNLVLKQGAEKRNQIETERNIALSQEAEKRNQIETERNFALSQEAEKRNRIETAIRAVALLGENNANATPHQIGGSLLALVNLGQIDLATALLGQLWPDHLVPIHVVDNVLARAFEDGTEHTKATASTILLRNGEQITQTGFNIWPFTHNYWPYKLSTNCRLGLVQAATKWMEAEIKTYKNRLQVPVAVVVLNKALDDRETPIRSLAAAALRPFVAGIREPDKAWILPIGTEGKLTMQEVSDHLRTMKKTIEMTGTVEIESRMKELMAPYKQM